MRQIKTLSQLSDQIHTVPQIHKSINYLIFNKLSSQSFHPKFPKIIVKNFVGRSTHNSLNQPLASQKLSHAQHHSIQKSANSKEYEKINPLSISQLPSPSHCPNIAKNIVKKFVGHFTHKSVNQPVKCKNLSHALPSIPLCPQIIIEIWDNLGNNHTEKSLLYIRMLRLWFSIPTIGIVKTRFNNASNILAINEFE
jgi:hypothetical protein